MRLMDYFEDFIREGGRKKPFKKTAIQTYRDVWSRFDRYMQSSGIINPIESDVIDFCDRVTLRNNNINTAYTNALHLNQIFAWLEKRGLYQNISKKAMHKYPRDKTPRSILPTDDQVLKIIEHAESASNQKEIRRVIWAMLYLHGLGNEEISKLKPIDFLNHDHIKRIRTVNGLHPISNHLMKLLQDYINNGVKGEYIFTDLSNRSRNSTRPIVSNTISTEISRLLKTLKMYIPYRLTARSLQIYGKLNGTIEIGNRG